MQPLTFNILGYLSLHPTSQLGLLPRHFLFPISFALLDLDNPQHLFSRFPLLIFSIALPLGPIPLQLSQSSSLPSLPPFGLSLSPFLGLARVLRNKIQYFQPFTLRLNIPYEGGQALMCHTGCLNIQDLNTICITTMYKCKLILRNILVLFPGWW